jgi:hypothetical protein
VIRELILRASLQGDALVAIWDDGSGKAAAKIDPNRIVPIDQCRELWPDVEWAAA